MAALADVVEAGTPDGAAPGVGDVAAATGPRTRIARVVPWLVGASLFVLYVGSATAGFLAPVWGAHFPISILPAGIAIGALFRWGKRWWPLIAVGATIVALALGGAWPGAALQGGATAAAAVLNVWMLRACGFRGDFETPRNVTVFVLAAAVGAFASVIAWSVAWWLQRGFDGSWTSMPARWWLSTFTSVLLVAPLVIRARRDELRRRHAGRREAAGWAALVVATSAGILLLPPAFNGFPLIAGLALLAWAVARLGLAYAAAAAVALCLASSVAAAFNLGLLANAPASIGQRLGWNTALLYSLWVLALNAFLVARERAERRYRRLFEQSPAPKWVTTVDGRRILAVNAAAAATYGYTEEEFTHLSVDDLVVDASPASDAHDSLQVHRCKDGRRLNVAVRVQDVDFDEGTGRLWYNVDVTERTRLRSELQRARSDERTHLSREMHDGLGQELTGISLLLAGLNRELRASNPALADKYERIGELARDALNSTRRIARGMSPLDPGESLAEGLRRRVDGLQGAIGCRVVVRIDAAAERYPMPDYVADGLYRIAQEALSNALRYSGGTSIEIEMRVVDAVLVLRVRDDGAGFDGRRTRSGLGLRTLGLRAEEIGAALRIDSAPGRGTLIECRWRPSAPA